MVLKVFSVYDSKAECFSHPMLRSNRAVFMRELFGELKKPTCPYVLNPADYTFFEIGEFDDVLGTFTSYQVKENLGLAINFVEAAASPLRATTSSVPRTTENVYKEVRQ